MSRRLATAALRCLATCMVAEVINSFEIIDHHPDNIATAEKLAPLRIFTGFKRNVFRQ